MQNGGRRQGENSINRLFLSTGRQQAEQVHHLGATLLDSSFRWNDGGGVLTTLTNRLFRLRPCLRVCHYPAATASFQRKAEYSHYPAPYSSFRRRPESSGLFMHACLPRADRHDRRYGISVHRVPTSGTGLPSRRNPPGFQLSLE